MHVRRKLRLLFFFCILVPYAIIFSMMNSYELYGNPLLSRMLALSLVGALLTVLLLPGVVVDWLIGRALKQMSALCLRVKQGDYKELLTLPNEARDSDEEDGIITLMRGMNWMARQIEVREKELQNAIVSLKESRKRVDEQNSFLSQMNDELIAMQEELQERTQALENACRQMQDMAMTDPLTAMANRRCFFETLAGHLAGSAGEMPPLSLLMIDIDRFKNINDTYGHQAGDQVLRTLAELIRNYTRSSDLAARIGGEEYALLLPATDTAGAVDAACRLAEAIASHAFLVDNDTRIAVTVSIGICTLVQPPRLGMECFYQYADQALYHSKRSGRNAVSIYEPATGSIRMIGCH